MLLPTPAEIQAAKTAAQEAGVDAVHLLTFDAQDEAFLVRRFTAAEFWARLLARRRSENDAISSAMVDQVLWPSMAAREEVKRRFPALPGEILDEIDVLSAFPTVPAKLPLSAPLGDKTIDLLGVWGIPLADATALLTAHPDRGELLALRFESLSEDDAPGPVLVVCRQSTHVFAAMNERIAEATADGKLADAAILPLVVAACVWPDRSAVEAVFARWPGISLAVRARLQDLAGVGAKATRKRL
jgi:hypothetical protein